MVMVPILFHFSTLQALWPSHLTPGTLAFSLYVRHCDHDHHCFCALLRMFASPTAVIISFLPALATPFSGVLTSLWWSKLFSFCSCPPLRVSLLVAFFTSAGVSSGCFPYLFGCRLGISCRSLLFPPPYQVYIITSTLSGVHNALSWDFYFLHLVFGCLSWDFYFRHLLIGCSSPPLRVPFRGISFSRHLLIGCSSPPLRVPFRGISFSRHLLIGCSSPPLRVPFRVIIVRLAPASALLGFIISLYYFPARSCECPYRVCNNFPARSCECPYRVCY